MVMLYGCVVILVYFIHEYVHFSLCAHFIVCVCVLVSYRCVAELILTFGCMYVAPEAYAHIRSGDKMPSYGANIYIYIYGIALIALLEKFWRISLYLTDDPIVKLYVT